MRTLFVIVATFFIPIHIGEFMVGYWMWLPILRVFDRPLSFDVNFWIDGSGRTCSFRWNWQLHGFKSVNFFNKLGSSLFIELYLIGFFLLMSTSGSMVVAVLVPSVGIGNCMASNL
jgi:hypothetical protein